MSGVCRRCGCTDARACPGGCWWVAPGLCSACDARMVRDTRRARRLRRLVELLPERARDWLAGAVVDVLWRTAAREQRRDREEERRHG